LWTYDEMRRYLQDHTGGGDNYDEQHRYFKTAF
jgi:hypothetical protein